MINVIAMKGEREAFYPEMKSVSHREYRRNITQQLSNTPLVARGPQSKRDSEKVKEREREKERRRK